MTKLDELKAEFERLWADQRTDWFELVEAADRVKDEESDA